MNWLLALACVWLIASGVLGLIMYILGRRSDDPTPPPKNRYDGWGQP